MEKRKTKDEELETVLTCCACPEQYDICAGGEAIGYVRLRWGVLTCRYGSDGRNPVRGKLLLRHDFGKEYKGCFSGDEERAEWLGKCVEAVARKHRNESGRVRRLRKHK